MAGRGKNQQIDYCRMRLSQFRNAREDLPRTKTITAEALSCQSGGSMIGGRLPYLGTEKLPRRGKSSPRKRGGKKQCGEGTGDRKIESLVNVGNLRGKDQISLLI